MNFPAELFPGGWYAAALLPWMVTFGWAVSGAPWARLHEGVRMHVWAGMIVALSLLWCLKAGVKPGLDFHLLGASLLALAFGPHLAIVALSIVLAIVTFNGAAAWEAFALNALVMITVPVLVSHAILRFAERVLPAHLFVYLFVNGFFGAALVVVSTGLTAVAVLALADVYEPEYLFNQYLPYYILLGFSEAWLTGMGLTLMVVYRPEWVSSFDDARYLSNK